MELIPVKSSNLNSVGYDAINSSLDIKFHEGHFYKYFNVPLNIYNGLKVAMSHGKYFDQHIKEHFRFIKIRKNEKFCKLFFFGFLSLCILSSNSLLIKATCTDAKNYKYSKHCSKNGRTCGACK